MTLLTSTSDVIRVVTGTGVSNIEVQASYVDLASGAYTPGSTETEITTATTTTVVAAPGASTTRRIKWLSVRNNSLVSSQVTVQKFNGTLAADLMGVTLLAGETLVRTEFADWMHFTAAGARYAYSAPQRGILGISGAKAETIRRQLCTETNLAVLTSGTMYFHSIWLTAGTVVSSISWFSATTAAGTPTNQFFALYGHHCGLLARSANDTTTAWAANSIKTLNMTTAYTVPKSGLYFLAIMVTATTVPTLKGVTLGTTLAGISFPPFVAGNSSSGLTTVLPPTAASPGATASRAWGCVS